MPGKSAALDAAVREAKELSVADQDAVACVIRETMAADRAWDKVLSDPRSEALLKRMADEARADIANGDVLDLDPSDHKG